MTPSELKYSVEKTRHDSLFFSGQNMKFAGDTMRNYGVRSADVVTNYDADGNYISGDSITVACWELYRKCPVKHGLKGSVYFCKTTFNRVFPSAEE